MTSGYKPTDAVVVIGQGTGRIAAVDGERITVRLSEGEVSIKLADADSLLRRVVDRDAAVRLLARLCERCSEVRSLPPLRSIRELARAPLDHQVEYTRWYFRKKKDLKPKEGEIVLVVSESVLAELAMALEVDESDLRGAVRRGRSTIESRAKRSLPTAPGLSGCKLGRSFWLGATALVGELPEQDGSDVLEVAVKPGAWHAYWIEEGEAENDDESSGGLLLRHADVSADVPLRSASIDLGTVNVEGGAIGVLDAAALGEAEFGADEVERLRRHGNGYGDRGVETSTEGDGDHRVLVDDKAVARVIFLPF